jgi:two-component system sensor histidine kinase AtoS
VNTEQKTKTIAVSLMDTGMGIPKEHLQRIFDPFFTTKNRGTGLGLYISRTIVENHGGHIEVVSEPGKGAVFTVLLPFRKDI